MNLATEYLGLTLSNPIIVGASPLCDDMYVARQLQDAGAAAVVMRSLFEEQFDPPVPIRTARARKRAPAAEGDLPARTNFPFTPEQYLKQLTQLKRTLSIPVIASLNGHRPGGWTDFARQLERAGADAIEVNAYQLVTDPSLASDQIETELLETVGRIAAAVHIPVAVKLSPYHTSLAQLAVALELAGAAGLVLFNRFYQPDVNVHDLKVQRDLHLSEPGELLLRLRWLAILSPNLRGSLCATGGIHAAEDLIKALLTGAHAVQVVSVLLKHGPQQVAAMLQGLQQWMLEQGHTDLAQFRGMLNLRQCPDAGSFERASYINILQDWKI